MKTDISEQLRYTGPLDEQILVFSIDKKSASTIDQSQQSAFTILWNTGDTAHFEIDDRPVELETGCISFFTEYHRIQEIDYDKLNVIQFNRAFHCVAESDAETGCRGILFYNPSTIPKLVIPQKKRRQFDIFWEMFSFEMIESDELKLDMLRAMLKRFLILSLRIYRSQSNDLPTDHSSLSIVREFNYLVSIHFKEQTQVQDYAAMLHKSPKTLSNIFKKFTDRSPVQIINEHRMRESRYMLKQTNATIQEISDELNFNDVQAFSNFFKRRQGRSPRDYRSFLEE